MRILLYLIAVILLLQNACTNKIKEKHQNRPNILFLSINDVNDFVGFLDGRYAAQTPQMDRLAEKGINFTNAHCATPACGPSRNALMFGMYPFNSGLYRYNQEMQEVQKKIRKKFPAFISLPQLLKENGYNTFASGEIHCYDWTYTYLKGKTEWTGHHIPQAGQMVPIESLGYRFDKSWEFFPTSNVDKDYQSHDVIDYGIKILNAKHDKPFFLALGLKEAHLPLLTPKKYYDLYTEPELSPANIHELSNVPEVGLKLAGHGKEYRSIQEAGKWGLVIHSYLAALSFIDHQIGRILESLENSRYSENTIVILWSDHGNHYGSKGKLTKFTLWEGATRVPLVIWDSREEARHGRVCRESTSLVDLYPTITSLTGIRQTDCLDGVDLTPWLKDPSLPREIPAIAAMGRGNYAVRTRDWRYIRYYDGGEELYHHTVDRYEQHNLASHREFDSQKERLRKWLPASEAPLIDAFAGRMKFHDADMENEK